MLVESISILLDKLYLEITFVIKAFPASSNLDWHSQCVCHLFLLAPQLLVQPWVW